MTTRAATWGASLALHAGLAVAGRGAFRGAPAIDATPAAAIDVDVTWEAPHLPPPVLDESASSIVPARIAMHSHPYPVPAGHDARPHDPSLVHAPRATATPSPPAQAGLDPAPGAQVVGAADEALPRFVLSVPASPVNAAGPVGKVTSASPATLGAANLGATNLSAGSLGAAGGGAGAGDAVLAESAVDVPARLLDNAVPDYPAAARAAEIEAELPFEIVVDERGAVMAARPLSRAGYGLDEAALRAVQRMRFSPALCAGRAVRVRMRWPVIFRLR